jgi:cytochrome c553
VRQAGALPTGAAPYQRTNGHELGLTAVPPGGSGTVTLHCTTCHNPHGTAYYRNLPRVTYAKGRNDLTRDVFLRGWARGQIAANYSADSVDFNEPNPRGSAMAEFCQECHRAFHTTTAPGGAWLRHPAAAAEISQRPGDHTSLALFAGRRYRVKVMSQTGDWGQQGAAWRAAPSGLTPTCITCHRAHGNRNPFGLITPTGTTAITEEGDGKVPVALCRQCHAQGLDELGGFPRVPQAP